MTYASPARYYRTAHHLPDGRTVREVRAYPVRADRTLGPAVSLQLTVTPVTVGDAGGELRVYVGGQELEAALGFGYHLHGERQEAPGGPACVVACETVGGRWVFPDIALYSPAGSPPGARLDRVVGSGPDEWPPVVFDLAPSENNKRSFYIPPKKEAAA